MAGTRKDWAKWHGKAVRGRKPTHLDPMDFSHGVRTADGNFDLGDDVGSSYPRHNAPPVIGARQQHAEAHRDNELARRDKAQADAKQAIQAQRSQAVTGHGEAQATGKGAPEAYSKEYFEDLQRKAHHPRTAEEKAQNDAQMKELYRGQDNYRPPVNAPTIDHKSLIAFDDKLPDTLMEFEDKCRQHPSDPEILEAKKEIVAGLEKAIKTYRRAINDAADAAREISPRSTEGRSAVSEAKTHLSAAQSYIDSALEKVDPKSQQLSVAVRIFRLAHIEMKSGLESADIALQDVDAVADRQIKLWTNVRKVCEIALTLLGGAVEAKATTVLGRVIEGGTAKIVLSTEPAIALGAEKLSSQWNGVPTNITWAEVIKKGLLDAAFTKGGNVLESRYFPEVDYFKEMQKISDPNLRAWALKNSASVLSSLNKELLQRAGSHQIDKYYGKPPEKLSEGVAEAAGREYLLDMLGSLTRAAAEAMPK